MPEDSGRNQVGQWGKGRSGNPSGKPKGVRSRFTLAAEALLEGEAERLTRKAVELALAGDTVALRLCLDRLLPPRKAGRTVRLNLPSLETPADLVAALACITRAVASGLVTPEEGQAVAAIMEQQRKAIELTDLERRIAELEDRHGQS
jgi:Family of unknown function (DUF5681)